MDNTSTPAIEIDAIIAGNWPQIQALLEQHYKNSSRSKKTIEKDKLIKLLQSFDINQNDLIAGINARLDESTSINAGNYSVIKFSDQLVDNYIINNKLHTDLKIRFNFLKVIITIQLLNENLIWRDKNFSQFLSLINQSSLGWQHDLGRAGNKHLAKITEILTSCDFKNLGTAINDCNQILSIYIDSEQQRIKKVEQRLIDKETGSLHTQHALQLSAKTLNKEMSGKQLPAEVTHFLQGPWRESMRLIIIHQGVNSEDWKKILLLTETLVWSVQPDNNDDNKKHQLILDSISELSEQLRESTSNLYHENNLDQELEKIEQVHLKILRGEKLNYQAFDLIDGANPLVNSQVSISSTLIEKASSFESGQWFIDHSSKEENRIKLCLKISSAQQLLFTNFIGIKAAQYSFEEFAYLLSSNTIKPLSNQDPLRATAEKILSTLCNSYQQRQAQTKEKQIHEQKIIREKLEERKTARRKALREAQEIAIEKENTQQRINQEKRQLQEITQQKAQQEQLLANIEKLQINARVEFIEDNNKSVCKIAAILQANEQYIFVDRAGVKRYAINKQQLTKKLLESSAKIIDYGSSFDDTLEKVVNNLRARKNNDK